jgi:hypothetical protein
MNAQDLIKTKSATELVSMWQESQRLKDMLMFNPTNEDRSEQLDAVIRVRIWLAQEMQAKMTDEEFNNVVDK